MIERIATGVARDDNVIADLERIAADTLAVERPGSAPFHGPALHVAVLVGRHDMDPRMRVPEHELHERTFDTRLCVLVVGRRERVMGECARRGCEAAEETECRLWSHGVSLA